MKDIKKFSPEKSEVEGSVELFMFVMYPQDYVGYYLAVYVTDRDGNFYIQHHRTPHRYVKSGATLREWLRRSDHADIIHIDDELLPAFEAAHAKFEEG